MVALTHALKVCSHRRLNKLEGLDLNWFGSGFEAKRLGLIDSCKKKKRFWTTGGSAGSSH